MNELSRHIEHLMLRHDCVTIPQLGAFVTQWIDATWAQDEPLLLPPRRSVRFNTDIIADDGLLVGSIQRTYNISPSEAKHKVQTLVLRLRQQLLTEGCADFGTLGQFTQDEDGNLTFEPCPAGAVTPTFYGMEALFFPRLDKVQKARAMRHNAQHDERPRLLSVSTNNGDIDIHIGHRLIRNVGVAAALAVLFFLLPIHIGTTSLHAPSEAAIGHHSSGSTEVRRVQEIQSVQEVQRVQEIQEVQEVQPSATTFESTINSVEERVDASKDLNAQVPQTRFAVVLASAIPQKRAERYASELTGKGVTGVSVLKRGKMVRVVIDGFLSEQRAHEEISALRERSSEFASAWVMRIDE